MVIVQFRGRLIGLVSLIFLGWEFCLISLYYVYKASQSCLLCFLCHPYIPHSNLKNLLVSSHFPNLKSADQQVSSNVTSSKKIPRRKVGTIHVQYMDVRT